ncbi:MAG: fimbrillin family protein [Parabacteroides sp.]|nr:fimbrillin family protein [Parabacteroides sp.]
MKKILESTILFVLSLLTLSCSKEDLPGNGEEVNGGALTINVVDKGYASQDSVSGTKATTDGSYVTTFVEGDEIGVYVVANNKIVQSNVKLTKNGSGWTAGEEITSKKDNEMKFFAYYPYDVSISSEKLTATANDAEGFFATYLSEIVLPTDQSDAGKYSKADIMVGDGSLAGTALTFGMEHQMGLVVIEIPKKFTTGTLYYLEGDESFTWEGSDYTESEVSELQFTGVTPYKLTSEPEDGNYVYRYLVNPEASAKSAIQGSFSVGGSSKSYTIETTSFPTEGGKYKTYSVGLGAEAVTKISHILKVGDFFMNDGSIIGKDSDLSPDQKSKCIGIVYYAGDPTTGEVADPKLPKKYKHGLVVALTDGDGSTYKCKWQETPSLVADWTGSNGYSSSELKEKKKIHGYCQTLILRAYDAKNSSHYLPVLDLLDSKISKAPLPEGLTSNWYLMSYYELHDLILPEYTKESTVVTSLESAGGSDIKRSEYHCSGELSINQPTYCKFYGGIYGDHGLKTNESYVRFAFAF